MTDKMTPEQREALAGPEHNNHPDFDSVEDITVGQVTLGIIKQAVNGHPLAYVHAHSESGKDGEAWHQAAEMILECHEKLDAATFEAAMEASLVFMGGDISDRVIANLTKATAQPFATKLETTPGTEIPEGFNFDVELAKAASRAASARRYMNQSSGKTGKAVARSSLLGKLMGRL